MTYRQQSSEAFRDFEREMVLLDREIVACMEAGNPMKSRSVQYRKRVLRAAYEKECKKIRDAEIAAPELFPGG